MVTISQILIKIGRNIPQAQAWERDTPASITFYEFERVMLSPGPFTLNSRKAINEKWAALAVYPGLVVSKAPQTGKATVYGLDPAVAKTLIAEAMPSAVKRRSVLEREHYIKTGEWAH